MKTEPNSSPQLAALTAPSLPTEKPTNPTTLGLVHTYKTVIVFESVCLSISKVLVLRG